MAKVSVSANRSTDKTIRAIDRKRERERRKMFRTAKEHAEPLTVRLVQRLIDREVIECSAVANIQKSIEDQLQKLPHLDDFDLQMKIAPLRTLVQDPNIVSLYLTQYVVEDLINHPDILDVFGDDLDIYRAIDSVMRVLRPQ
ncbi:MULTISPECIES: hypothetical protein [Desulfosediminicola]|uniref:hypothetical protein n=1 Tax=Desulfosediminicola TaxID=2886823 RepID=UPI0010AB6646|nr:hypothetical protein [Desulfosediminicola ganghwensis]